LNCVIAPGTATRDAIKSAVPVHAFSDVTADDVSRMCAGQSAAGKSSIAVVSSATIGQRNVILCISLIILFTINCIGDYY